MTQAPDFHAQAPEPESRAERTMWVDAHRGAMRAQGAEWFRVTLDYVNGVRTVLLEGWKSEPTNPAPPQLRKEPL